MKGDAELLDRIRELGTSAVDATVVRILPTGIPPDRENILGARWNPRGTPAIYTAFEAPTARAEIAFRISLEPVPMKDISRTEYRIEVRLQQVVNLTADAFDSIGFTNLEFTGIDYTATQAVGGAVASLGSDGLMVPSARWPGINLVIYPANAGPAYRYQVVGEAPIKF